MLARPQIHEHQPVHAFRHSAVRVGVMVGLGLSLALSGWIYFAYSMPIFERVSVGRNLAAAFLIGSLALFPVLRYFREPGNLLISSLLAWSMLSLAYLTFSLFYWALSDWFSASQIFMLGALLYLIAATVSWIGTCIWKARAAHLAPPRHRAS